jgi:nicotinamide mononucleotide transporter
MDGLLTTLADQASRYSLIEFIAVLLAIAYLPLAIRQNIWCWLCAGISSAIYVYLFVDAKLYMESVLNVFYFAMAIYGWVVWTSGRAGTGDLPVVVWPAMRHAVAILAILMVSAVNGFLLQKFTDAVYPYIDSLTTWGAMWATFLVARKVLENWWYWLVIDLASIFIYWSRELELTAMLFIIYVIMIPFGLVSWTRSWRTQAA